MLNQEQEFDQQTSTPSENDTAFNAVIWANSLLGTGNTNYQNEFYYKQAKKIGEKFADGNR